MSSPRSRSGGRRTCTTLSRKYRSARKRPSRTSTSSGRWVAATMRTSTRCSRRLPMRRTVFSSSSLSSLPCKAMSMSPISSRNKVPPSAVSTRPSLRSRASVKAPRSCPNSSDSSNCAGSAAQFNSTKGLSRRSPLKCSARATSSLPVPVSPSTSTAGASASRICDSACINCAIVCFKARIGPDSPSRASSVAICASRFW